MTVLIALIGGLAGMTVDLPEAAPVWLNWAKTIGQAVRPVVPAIAFYGIAALLATLGVALLNPGFTAKLVQLRVQNPIYLKTAGSRKYLRAQLDKVQTEFNYLFRHTQSLLPAPDNVNPIDINATYFKEQTIPLMALGPEIKGKTFEDCVLLGPAVLLPVRENTLDKVRFLVDGGEGLEDALFIEVPKGIPVQGVYALDGSTFRRCTFHRCAILGSREILTQFKRSLKKPALIPLCDVPSVSQALEPIQMEVELDDQALSFIHAAKCHSDKDTPITELVANLAIIRVFNHDTVATTIKEISLEVQGRHLPSDRNKVVWEGESRIGARDHRQYSLYYRQTLEGHMEPGEIPNKVKVRVSAIGLGDFTCSLPDALFAE